MGLILAILAVCALALGWLSLVAVLPMSVLCATVLALGGTSLWLAVPAGVLAGVVIVFVGVFLLGCSAFLGAAAAAFRS